MRTLRLAGCLWMLLWIALALPVSARDRGADGNFNERQSRHFLLLQDVDIDRYTGLDGSRKFERDVLAVLEAAYDDVRDVLDVDPGGRTRVIIYDAGVYDRQFAGLFGFRSAGFYDGAIHVRAGSRVDTPLARTLHHEYVHAALSARLGRGRLPAWLNEGLAEYFERPFGYRGLTAGELAVLRRAIASGAWIPITSLSGTALGHLDANSASLAYLQAFAMIDHLVRIGGPKSLERLCEQIGRSGEIAAALKRTYRADLAALEQGLIEGLR